MGRLTIKQVEYVGDQYYYKSPILKPGLNILEGRNGSGKTTFVDLICFVFGIYVREFDVEGPEVHKEVCNDTENYVIAKIAINNSDYCLKRFFRSNVIFVTEDELIKEYPINRVNSEVFTFSDWILSKLGIAVVEIYQGTRKSKINFADLFRLIHYDQDTTPYKIFKTHRNENNFIADSQFVRKVIFELLMGNAFSDYYSKIGDVIRLERERDTKKSVLENYQEIFRQTFSTTELINSDELYKKRDQTILQLDKATLYREDLKKSEYTNNQMQYHVENLRRQLGNMELRHSELSTKKLELLREIRNIEQLKEEVILEVTQLKKIIVAHEELNIFSPDTCPYCLKHVERKVDHCICGTPINESEYERFFYTSEEYLDILKSKQKSVDTIQTAWESCNNEIEQVAKLLLETEMKRDKIKSGLRELNTITGVRNEELNEVDDKILDLKEKMQKIDQQLEMQNKLDSLHGDFEKAKSKLEQASSDLHFKEQHIKSVMQKKLDAFNKIYNTLMMNSSKDVYKARIDEDYIPVINEGEYLAASSAVPKRFMYYLTMLNMSLSDNDMLFPKFLLIDTPENLGIDHEDLADCISKIVDQKTESQRQSFQVILTTGVGKYPEELKTYVLQTLTKENRLLQKKASKKNEPHNQANIIVEAIRKNVLMGEDSLQSQIRGALISSLDGADIYVEASSNFEYEVSDVFATYVEHKFSVDEQGMIGIDVVKIEGNEVVLQMNADVTCDVSASFSFSVWDSSDKESMPMGSRTYSIQETYNTDILISLTGDFNDSIEKLDVDDIQVLSVIENVDFGEVEPNWQYEE